MSDKEELTQREWDRIVGIGKKQPPAKGEQKNIPLDPKAEYVVVPLSPFTNHQPTIDRFKKSNDEFNKNVKND